MEDGQGSSALADGVPRPDLMYASPHGRAETAPSPRAQPEAYDEEIRRWESEPRTQGWAVMLWELRGEPVARLTVREWLERELDR